MPSIRTSALPLLTAAAVALAACGGSTKSSTKNAGAPTPKTTTPIVKVSNFRVQAGLLGGAASAGTSVSYVPTGKIVADNGFRPNVNGFGFQNYGNDAGPINLTPSNVEDLFGPQVCAVGTGAHCVLTPSARAWMQQENQVMANGHCMGFSVTALRFFTGNLTPTSYGSSAAPTLPIVGNDKLQELIAEDFAYQNIPSVVQHAVQGTPGHVLQALISALNARKDTYTVAIFKANGNGGHAITPFAVEDKGGGLFEILVYDNNFPGIIRKIDVNANTNTWQYIGGVNPSDTNETYNGDAQTKSMFLLPTNPGEGAQPCPFCAAKGDTNPNPGSLQPSQKRYLEVALLSNPGEHAHLLFVDPATGQKTGYVNGTLVQQIPGILVNRNLALQNWKSTPEPTYDVQFGHPPYEVFVDGTKLTHQVVEKITVNGGGVLFTISAINVEPGQKDQMLLPKNDFGIAYQSNAPFGFSPLLNAEFVTYGNNKAQPRFVQVFTSRLGFKPGAPYTLVLKPQYGVVLIGNPTGATPARKNASYEVFVASTPLAGGPPARTYKSSNVQFDGNTQAAQFPYFNQQGKTLPVLIVNKTTNKVVKTVQVPRG
jgi:hypothetical protein